MLRERKAFGLDGRDHAFRELVGAVGIEMRVVLDVARHSFEGAGLVVDKGALGAFRTHRFVEDRAHPVQVEEDHVLATGHLFHRLRVVGVGFDDAAVGVEVAPVRRRNEHRDAAFRADLVDEDLELQREEVVAALAGAAEFLVVVAELHENIVARLQHGKDLAQASGADEGVSPLAALPVVRDGHVLVEEAREHLPPAGPGLGVLVHDRGIAAEEDRGHPRRGGLDAYRGHRRGVAVEFEREIIVPVEFEALAGLGDDFRHRFPALADRPVTLVDDEADRARLAFGRRQVVDAEAARLGLDEGAGRELAGAELQRDEVVAVRHGDAQREMRLRLGGVIMENLREIRRPGGKAQQQSGQEEKGNSFHFGSIGPQI